MIISRTPLRISFVGGGSDLPSYYRQSKGAVLSTSIDKYVYISVHPYFHKNKFLFKYSKTEEVGSLNDIIHPLIRLSCKYANISSGIEFTSSADVPAGTGLGSSSSFTVGALNCLYEYNGQIVSKENLADLACKIEIQDLGAPIGKQDQFAASFGGLNVIEFDTDESVHVNSLEISDVIKRELEEHLICFYIGGSRSANDILNEQSARLSDDTIFKIQTSMVDIVYESKKALESSKLIYFGELLNHNWNFKKKLSSGISNEKIDSIYKKGLENGAIGGKLLGAGGTGFMLFLCPPERQFFLSDALGLKQLNFKFDGGGSKIVYNSKVNHV